MQATDKYPFYLSNSMLRDWFVIIFFITFTSLTNTISCTQVKNILKNIPTHNCNTLLMVSVGKPFMRSGFFYMENLIICKRCSLKKEPSGFYPKKDNKSGLMLICKICKNELNKINREKRKQDHDYMAKYRSHNLVRKKLSDANGKSRALDKKKKENGTYLLPAKTEKYYAVIAVNNNKSIPKIKGHHRHHWSYKKENWFDVIILTIKHHAKAHRYMIYDNTMFCYKRKDTLELLDSRVKHEEFIFNTIKEWV